MKKISTLIAFLICLICEIHAQTPATGAEHNYSSFTADKKIISPELQSLTDKQFYDHPEFGVLPYNAPCTDCTELLQKRDETHRYFVKNGSKGHEFYAQTSYSHLNYRDANGVFHAIDTRIKPTLQQGVYRANEQYAPVTINVAEKYTSILNGDKELQFNRDVTIFIRHKDGSVTSLGEPDWSNYTAGDDGAVVHNLYPGIDLEFRVGNGHVESFYRLNKPLNLKGAWLVVRDKMKIPEGLIYNYTHSEKMDNGYYTGTLFLDNAQGTHYFYVGIPAAYDENTEHSQINLNYQIADNGVYDIYVPVAWMNDPNRSYPLVIDPFVSATSTLPDAVITGSGYNATCFQNGCSYLLNVNVPAACTVTDLTCSFYYQALGVCTMDSAAWNLTWGTCYSPHNPATDNTHSCGLPLAGLCEMPSESCFADFEPCLSPAQCSAYSIPISFNLYRCTRSDVAPGCGFSCVNADSSFSMTVTGYTLALDTAIGLSATNDTTICAGSYVILTATADSSDSSYTYIWYPGGLVSNSIVVMPTTSTTYTVTVNTCGGIDSATATVSVTVDTSANASFLLYPDTGHLHTYIAVNLATGIPPIQYYWTWGDGGYDIIPYPSHIYVDSGFYTICLSITDSTGCQSTYCDSSFHAMRTTNTMVYVNVVPPLITGTQTNNSKTPAVTIYPNPATNQLTIHSSSINTNDVVTVSIMNILGQSMQEERINWTNETNINIKTLSAGIYFVMLQNESGARWVGRFVKQIKE